MRLTKYEQETIVSFNEKEAGASVYTHNRSLRKKLKQLSEERPAECKLERTSHDGQAVEYIVPKAWVKIIPSRILSAEQRAAMAERMKSNLARKHPTIIRDFKDENGR